MYSLISNSVESFTSLEAIHVRYNQRPHKSSLLVAPNFIWIGEEIVCRERMATADNTPVRFLWIHLCCLCSRFVDNDNNTMVQAVKYDQFNAEPVFSLK